MPIPCPNCPKKNNCSQAKGGLCNCHSCLSLPEQNCVICKKKYRPNFTPLNFNQHCYDCDRDWEWKDITYSASKHNPVPAPQNIKTANQDFSDLISKMNISIDAKIISEIKEHYTQVMDEDKIKLFNEIITSTNKKNGTDLLIKLFKNQVPVIEAQKIKDIIRSFISIPHFFALFQNETEFLKKIKQELFPCLSVVSLLSPHIQTIELSVQDKTSEPPYDAILRKDNEEMLLECKDLFLPDQELDYQTRKSLAQGLLSPNRISLKKKEENLNKIKDNKEISGSAYTVQDQPEYYLKQLSSRLLKDHNLPKYHNNKEKLSMIYSIAESDDKVIDLLKKDSFLDQTKKLCHQNNIAFSRVFLYFKNTDEIIELS